jgi:TRAP-type C4-dicarboxylate transport system substrate-binding protein
MRLSFLLLTGSLLFSTAAPGAVQLKIATVAPDGSQWMQDLRAAADEIKIATEGRAAIKFYSGGVMGNEKKVLRKIRIGQLQGGMFTANGLTERYSDIAIYGLPLVFRSEEEVTWVREKMDPILTKGLDEAGFVSFGFATAGFAKIMGREPVTRLEDLRGRKIWVPEGDQISYVAMQSFGLSPVVLPITDVLTGLQTGLLEFIATPAIGAVVLQWYTKIKYVTDLPLAYAIGIMAIDKRAFSHLSESDQVIFRDIMSRTYRAADKQGWLDDAHAEEALRANGLQMITLEESEIALMRKAAADANQKMAADGVFAPELLDQLKFHLKEFRAGAGPAPLSADKSE